MRKKTNNFKRHFTLVELVVAMGIFSILMLALMTFFNSAQKIWTASAKRNNLYADSRVAMDLMAGMVQTAFYQADSPHTASGIARVPFYVKRTTVPTYNYKADQICFMSDSIVPLTNVNPASTTTDPYSKLYKVTFFLDQLHDAAKNRNNDLYIRFFGDGDTTNNIWNFVDADGTINWSNFTTILPTLPASGTAVNITNAQIVISHVLSLEFNAFKAPSSTFTKITLDTSTPVQEFPLAVEIKMTMLDRENYTKWIAMGATGDPNDSGETGPRETFRKENEKTFTRIIYLGDRF